MSLITLADIDQRTKLRYARRLMEKSAASLLESQEAEYPLETEFDVFLSHSYHDAKLNKERLLGLKGFLQEFNLTVYVDWLIDKHLDREKVTAGTAEVLRVRMDHSKCLLFATSENSQDSRWMPWELGYMDGKKGMVAVLPLAATSGHVSFDGQEYLGMYYYVDAAKEKGGETVLLWVNQNTSTYVEFRKWLTGGKPTDHKV